MTVTAEKAVTDRTRYRFSPLERRGVIAGWRGGQIGSVAAGLVVGVLAVRSRPSIGGIALALLGVSIGVAAAFWPVQGRTGDQWLPLLLHWTWVGGTGTRRQLAPGPERGHRLIVVDRSPGLGPDVLAGPQPESSRQRPEGLRRQAGFRPGPDCGPDSGSYPAFPSHPLIDVRPAPMTLLAAGRRTVFDGVDVVAAPLGAGSSTPQLGIVVDGPARTATAVLAVRGHSFALLGPRDQDARIAGWARMLSSLAREGSAAHRVQWIESCLPDDGTAVRDYWADHAVLGVESPAGRSYQELVDGAAPVNRRHRVLVGISIRTSRSFRSGRSGKDGLAPPAGVLAREIQSLHSALDGADVTVEGVLGPGALSRMISDSYASRRATTDGTGAPVLDSRTNPHCNGRPAPADDRARIGRPWPLTIESSWDGVHTDATWHSTYWIAEWPRVDVTPDFLGPLLFSPLRRTISMVMEPVSPLRAARQVAQARTADLADGELRRRGGFLVTASHRRQRESVEERDTELADGHAQYRFSGYLTVTADTKTELEAARAAAEQAAGQAGLELRLLYGAQDAAFARSLPLGRGLS